MIVRAVRVAIHQVNIVGQFFHAPRRCCANLFLLYIYTFINSEQSAVKQFIDLLIACSYSSIGNHASLKCFVCLLLAIFQQCLYRGFQGIETV